ncbi:GntR family transcriptional regulator [Rhizobium sp. YS-1r]|jgi:DNA-binding GntR family transcriptional regulator|uniref:GntR family transcriptional regulator n=1 Tax=Rhizobium sp. YS-1r TaxID=1532558 RepID=UPI00050E701C|nr:GntR family transcriptional regulator [Rhizobium sp. YS-1r]KGD87366.1 GntR family transcriptional regulator [Rhizobium sp. YS-1r]
MADTGLSKVTSRVTVQDTVYEQLRRALMWGSFAPSQAITISSLATEFGTSHMPVREALRRLAAENGLEIGHNGSARVPAVSRQRLDDLCQARIALEGLATELAAARVINEDMDRLEALAREHEETGKAGDVYGMLRKNQAFHFSIYEMSGSEVLPQHIEMLWLRFGPYMRMLTNYVEREFDKGVVHPFSSYHFQIVAALRERNGVLAREMMVGDILATQVLLRDMCSE